MIKEVLVVEGRSDVARIRASQIDVDMITTDGFNLKPHTLEQIRCAYEKRGIIILTDPDRAGEQIRKFLTDRFPNAKHAFIPRKTPSPTTTSASNRHRLKLSDWPCPRFAAPLMSRRRLFSYERPYGSRPQRQF